MAPSDNLESFCPILPTSVENVDTLAFLPLGSAANREARSYRPARWSELGLTTNRLEQRDRPEPFLSRNRRRSTLQERLDEAVDKLTVAIE